MWCSSDDPQVEARPAGEAQDGRGERVVHEPVEAVAREPVGRLGPDLADQVCLGVDGPAAAPELGPEGRVLDLRRHVEAPAVDAEPEPVLADPEAGIREPAG